jgi:hypothetical protein
MQEAYQSVDKYGYGRFHARDYRKFLEESLDELPRILESFARLQADRYMGDGGKYRYRAYSRFQLDAEARELLSLPGNSIYQELEDNPLNGGVERTYAPLETAVADSPWLHAIINLDFTQVWSCDPGLREGLVVVGVHQVRIVARGETAGLPSPEGIHRDRERFTFQHFMGRTNAVGGEFRAYDADKRLLFAWQQEECLDTVMFKGTTWHSATSITAVDPEVLGFRDIFLIDFDRWEG